MKILSLVVLLALAGCSKKSNNGASACTDAVNKAVDQMIAKAKQHVAAMGSNLPPAMKARIDALDGTAGKLKGAIVNRCTQDKWSSDVIKCYAAASSMPEFQKCRALLPPDQQKQLKQDEVQAMMGAMGKGAGMRPHLSHMPHGHFQMTANPGSGSAAAGSGAAPGSAAGSAPAAGGSAAAGSAK